MSDDNSTVLDSDKSKSEDKVVPAKAYEEVKADMIKYKSEMKNLMDKLSKFEVSASEAEKKRLEEKEEFKKLYEQENKARLELLEKHKSENGKLVNGLKIQAVKSELKFKKPQYINFVNLSDVEIGEDGNPTQESLQRVIATFKQDYSDLLEVQQVKNTPASIAPNANKPGDVPLSKMSKEEMTKRLNESVKIIIEQGNKK